MLYYSIGAAEPEEKKTRETLAPNSLALSPEF